MKKKIDMHVEFVKKLNESGLRKNDLVNKISDILLIEKEAVYRRLNGRVYFTAQEMGILAFELHISLDHIVYGNDEYQWFPFLLGHPMGGLSIDSIYDIAKVHIETIVPAIFQGKFESGMIFNTLPLDFYLSYPNLLKYMFFKWGHHFVGTEEFYNFAQWELPDWLKDECTKCNMVCGDFTLFMDSSSSLTYIWDSVLIWSLAKEFQIFQNNGIISKDDMENIKSDVKKMLKDLEHNICTRIASKPELKVNFYISMLNAGCTSGYFGTEAKHIAFFHTVFSQSKLMENHDTYIRQKKWIESLKNVCILISKSGVIRHRFFKEQHKILDVVLK